MDNNNTLQSPQISVAELARAGKNLQSQDQAEIFYPSDGSQRLAKAEKQHFWFVARRKLILRLLRRYIKKSPTEPILGIDVGCGTGYTAVWLTQSGLRTLGLDVHPGFAPYKNQNNGCAFVMGDIFSIEPKPEFDVVLLLDVVEHLEDDRKFVDQVAKLLRPGGIMMMTVPAFAWQWSRTDEINGHFRRYSKSDMRRFTELQKNPMQIEYQTYFYALTLPLYLLLHFLMRNKSVNDNREQELKINPVVNWVLNMFMKLEGAVASVIPLPIGSSLFTVLRKPLVKA